MSEGFSVRSSRGDYSVEYVDWRAALNSIAGPFDFYLLDANVAKFYPEMIGILDEKRMIIISVSEDSKTYTKIGTTIEELIALGASRSSRLVAIGGGVIQDIVSFSASIMFRGIEWVFFPTNLASQCDSCIGSKTSVNLGNKKNQLGGFYPPSSIFIDPAFTSSLTKNDIRAGIGEMYHYFLVDKISSFKSLGEETRTAVTDQVALSKLVKRSLDIKRGMIEIDEFDKGPRLVFNYGHTFGHALESVTDFSVPHGIAVAYGIDLANLISVKLGFIDITLRNSIRQMIEHVWEDMPLDKFRIQAYFDALVRDKKSVNGRVHAILTRGVGDMFLSPVDMTDDMKFLISSFFEDHLYQGELCEI